MEVVGHLVRLHPDEGGRTTLAARCSGAGSRRARHRLGKRRHGAGSSAPQNAGVWPIWFSQKRDCDSCAPSEGASCRGVRSTAAAPARGVAQLVHDGSDVAQGAVAHASRVVNRTSPA